VGGRLGIDVPTGLLVTGPLVTGLLVTGPLVTGLLVTGPLVTGLRAAASWRCTAQQSNRQWRSSAKA
jgi:hypothetical protein